MEATVPAFLSIAILGAIVWGPTVLVYRRQRSRGEPVTVPSLVTALLVELTAVIVTIAIVMWLDVPHAGAYLLAVALLVGAVGAQVCSRVGFK